MSKVKKLMRSIKLYGLSWSLVKVAGRTRNPKLRFLLPGMLLKPKARNTSLIGCGQFGFGSISYHLFKGHRNFFLDCYDLDQENSVSTANFWGFSATSIDALYENKRCTLIYIASNHASHTPYAIRALGKDINTYVEKPVSVTRGQFTELLTALKQSKASLYVGYNRPFSKAITKVSSAIKDMRKPLSLSFFVTGHFLAEDHWYRNPEEGTRVCGNMGHWIDLSVHLMAKRGAIPEEFNVGIAYGSKTNTDDNLIVSYSTSYGDVVSICLTARAEPFEGINETINLQVGSLIAKIDDFRQLQLWDDVDYTRVNYRRKDIGHSKAILQPHGNQKRDFKEIVVSTLLMLHIKDMVESASETATFRPLEDDIYKNFFSS